jgi:hypothetical protein
MSRISRRRVLRCGAAATIAGLFTRDATNARAAGARPLRLVLLMQANGTSQANFWPVDGTSVILDPVLSNQRLRDRTTIVKGLFNHGGGAGGQHDQGFSCLFTGRRPVGTFTDPWGGGPSLDQTLAGDLIGEVPFPTLNCGVLAQDSAFFKAHRGSFSYFAARQPVPTEVDPLRLWTRLFGGAGDVAEAKRRLERRKSVLDFATSDLDRLRTRLGTEERDKLDVHATAIREYELRLSMLASRTTSAACRPPAPAPLDSQAEQNVPLLLPSMFDLVALALACDLVRIVTFPIGNAAVNWRYDWLGIGKNSHDDIAHHDDGKTPQITDYVVRIGKWHAEHVARLALALDAVPEGDGTVLDNTLIVWGNELATGQHSLDGIPLVLIGGGAGRLVPAGLVDVGPQTYHRLGCTLLRMAGKTADGFGEEESCGPLGGLTIKPPA